MTAPRVNTITLSVAQGDSPHPTATFGPAMAARQVAVGSGNDAQWKVRAVGVEPVHCELYWDGNILWVRDAGSLSGVYVGTERADEWQQIFDGTEVLFGGAVLRAKVVGPDAHPGGQASAAAPARSTSAAFLDEEESTVVFSNQPLLDAMRASAPAPAPAPAMGPPPGALGGPAAPARLATMAPARVGAPQVPALPGRPGMGAAQPPPAAPSLPPKAPVSEATVIRPSPYAAMEAAGMLPGGPMAPGDRPDERTVMANPGELLANAGIAMPMVQPPRSATMAPPLAPGLQPMSPAAMPPPAFGGLNPMAPALSAPPGMHPMGHPQHAVMGHEADDPFGPMELPPPPGAPGKGLTTLPPRTLALAGIVLALCALLLMLGPAQHQSPATAQGAGPARPSYVVRTVGAPAPTSNNILQLPIGAPGLVGVIVPAPLATVDAQGRPRPVPPPNPADPIRLAAEAVAANRYADAAVLYERLAAQHPEAPLFRQFATVLRARAAQPRCNPGASGCNPAPAPTAPSSPTPEPPAAAPAAAAPAAAAPTPTAAPAPAPAAP